MKPYAESSEVNKVPILAVLKDIFANRKRVLEIASGTGQHAVYFGRELPHLTWQPSELKQNIVGIQAWLDEAQLTNVPAPLAIDVNDARWPIIKVDAVFNANTVHIISWPEVERMSQVLLSRADACVSTGHTTITGNSPLKVMPVSMTGSSRATRPAVCVILKR
jgi:hypothetical protein